MPTLPPALEARYVTRDELPALGRCQRVELSGREGGGSYRLDRVAARALGLDPEAIRQLRAVGQTATTLVHPHLARVVEVGEDADGAWAVEQAAELVPLAVYLRECPSPQGRVRVALDLWDALAYLHGRGEPHGCLCPGTLWVSGGGGLIGGLGLCSPAARVAGREQVLGAGTDGAPVVLPTPAQDVRDLAEALLWLGGWPDWMAEALRAAQEDPRPAGELAGLLAQQALAHFGDETLMAPVRRTEREWIPAGAAEDEVLAPGKAAVSAVSALVRGVVSSLATLAVLLALTALAVIVILGPAPEVRTVPNLVGMPLAEAEKRAAESKMNLAVASYDYSADVEEGCLISTDPYPGKTVRVGRQIRARVSVGRKQIKVPSLTGLSATVATEKLAALHLAVGETRQQASPKDPDVVLNQSPAPKTMLPRNAKVDLVISGGPDYGQYRTADGKRFIFRTVDITVPRGKSLQTVTVEVRGGEMDRTFQERLCQPGENLKVEVYGPPGARVRVKIDDERVFSESLG